MIEFPPAATYRLPFQATPRRWSEVPENRFVQVTPSGLVAIFPFSPTTTYWPLPQVTA